MFFYAASQLWHIKRSENTAVTNLPMTAELISVLTIV